MNPLTRPIPSPGKNNVLFMVFAILPQLACAFGLACVSSPRFGRVAQPAFIFLYMLIPCRDRHFGNGRPFHYVRQAIFFSAFLLSVELFCL